MSPLPCGLSRDHRPRYVSGTPRPYAGGRIWIGRFSSLPCARRNGRASASLTARGGGLPIGVTAEEGVECGDAARTPRAEGTRAVRPPAGPGGSDPDVQCPSRVLWRVAPVLDAT